MKRAAVLVVLAAIVVVLGFVPLKSGAALQAQTPEVLIVPNPVAVTLGETVDFEIAVTNALEEPVSDAIVHIDITSLADAGSVDPEDWTETLSKPAGELSAGGTNVIDWTVQPIAPGDFTLYAVMLSPDTSTVRVSDRVTISVTDRRSLNPQGVLPVAIAVPASIGVLLATRSRRTSRPAPEVRQRSR